MAAVCVYCSSSESIDASFVELAAAVGTRIAAGGHTLVSGGGRVSMMGAVARAARAGGAHTVGVIPRHLVSIEVADNDADELVVVDTMRERKAIMDERADAFLVLPGGIGTLEEFFEVWTAGALGMHDKPVIVLDPAGFFTPLWSYLDTVAAAGFLRPAAFAGLARVTDVEAAFSVVESLTRAAQT
jgi:uncharacterized protein (TIGR00730 family)